MDILFLSKFLFNIFLAKKMNKLKETLKLKLSLTFGNFCTKSNI
jgi:hypothetical protein